MNRNAQKTKIDELALLRTILHFSLNHEPPTAKELGEKWSLFASLPLKADTLRMWLLRHSRQRFLNRAGDTRPFHYKLTSQGYKRIVYLEKKKKIQAELKERMNQQIANAEISQAINQMLGARKAERSRHELIQAIKELLETIHT